MIRVPSPMEISLVCFIGLSFLSLCYRFVVCLRFRTGPERLGVASPGGRGVGGVRKDRRAPGSVVQGIPELSPAESVGGGATCGSRDARWWSDTSRHPSPSGNRAGGDAGPPA